MQRVDLAARAWRRAIATNGRREWIWSDVGMAARKWCWKAPMIPRLAAHRTFRQRGFTRHHWPRSGASLPGRRHWCTRDRGAASPFFHHRTCKAWLARWREEPDNRPISRAERTSVSTRVQMRVPDPGRGKAPRACQVQQALVFDHADELSQALVELHQQEARKRHARFQQPVEGGALQAGHARVAQGDDVVVARFVLQHEPSPNQLPVVTPMKVMALPVGIIILTRPLMTPIQWSTGSPLRQTKPPVGTKRSHVPYAGDLHGIEQRRPVGRAHASFRLISVGHSAMQPPTSG